MREIHLTRGALLNIVVLQLSVSAAMVRNFCFYLMLMLTRMMKDHNACSYCHKKKRVEDLILEMESEVMQDQPRRKDPMTVGGGPGVTTDGAQQQWRGQNHTGLT